MKLFIVLIATIFLINSCGNRQSKSKYVGLSKGIKAVGNINDGKEEGFFEFYNETGNVISSGGFLNGFRFDTWYYNVQDSLIQFKWMPFNDKNLEFATNVLSPVDTVYYGDYYTQFDYFFNGEGLSLSISINSPFMSAIFSNGYEESVKQELKNLNYSVDTFLVSNLSGITVYSYLATNTISGKKIFTNTAYGFIDKDVIQIITNSTGKLKNEYNETLLEGVLTNLYYKGRRFYNPFISQ